MGFAVLVLMVCLGSLEGNLPKVTALVCLVISLSLYRPYQDLMELSSYRHLQAHIVNRIAEIWDVEPLSVGSWEAPSGDTSVTFDDVTFGYRDGRTVLHGANFVARAGEITALVGASGSGKSTVANLVARFWDVDSGSVRIGDVDVRDLTSAAPATQVATVYQDVYLFPTTIRENLYLGSKAEDRELEQVLRAAQAWGFVHGLPDGLDAEVTDGGNNLSGGGERQRVSIARALLKDALILLLDEAVASVDPETEVRIQKALGSLVVGRTVIVVAHRLNTIRSADQIVVLANGGVEATGTHEDLLDRSPTYRRMWTANHPSEETRI